MSDPVLSDRARYIVASIHERQRPWLIGRFEETDGPIKELLGLGLVQRLPGNSLLAPGFELTDRGVGFARRTIA